MNFPDYHFDSSLRDVPNSKEAFDSFMQKLTELLNDASKDEYKLLSNLGVACRIMGYLDKSELYLTKAHMISKDELTIFTSEIRLAHCFQWQNRFDLSNAMFAKLASSPILKTKSITNSFFWQHKGKNEFDQQHYTEAFKCFEESLRIRVEEKASQELIDSALISIDETKKRLHL